MNAFAPFEPHEEHGQMPSDNTGLLGGDLTLDVLRNSGFAGFLTFREIRERVSPVPATAGAYVVVREPRAPAFLEKSCAGYFKGKNPTEMVHVLERKWVPGTAVIYIGRAIVLSRRLEQYAGFGAGRPVGHWGGRYIWQLADSAHLRVAWRICADGKTAAHLEAELASQFRRRYGRLPFANIAEPSG